MSADATPDEQPGDLPQAPPGDLPEDIAAHWRSYEAMFGRMPPLPARRIAYLARTDPDALRHGEASRARAFEATVFDARTTQLLILAMLVSQGAGAARWHAIAARRAGATEAELRGVVELAGAVAALGPLNTGHAMLGALPEDPTRASPSPGDGA